MSSIQEAGTKDRLVTPPPFGNDSYLLFISRNGIPIWTPKFNSFLMELGIGEIKKR